MPSGLGLRAAGLPLVLEGTPNRTKIEAQIHRFVHSSEGRRAGEMLAVEGNVAVVHHVGFAAGRSKGCLPKLAPFNYHLP